MKNNIVIFSLLFLTALYVLKSPSQNHHLLAVNQVIKKKLAFNNKINNKLLPVDFGNPYMNHFKFGQTDLQIWGISQDADGVMIFAHRQGVIIFNGKDWEQVRIPSIPITLKSLDDQKIILLGCENEYGYLQRSKIGNYEYHKISDKTKVIGDITDIKVTDKYIYFYSDKVLIRHDRKSLKLDQSWLVSENRSQNGIIQIQNDIYISIDDKGLYKLGLYGKKTLVPKTLALSSYPTIFSIPLTKNKVIIGNTGNALYIFDGKSISEFQTTAQKYIQENQLTGGTDLTEDVFAISTITGGGIILNKKNGEIVNILDIKSGLPDNEIYAIGKDQQGGLWLSHGFGVSRVNYNLPVKDFNYYQGLEGNIIDVVVMNNKTYIATNQGVYYQDSVLQEKDNITVKPKKSTKENKLKELINNTIINEVKENKNEEILKNEEEIKPVVKEKKNVFQKWKERREEKKKKKNIEIDTNKQNDKEELKENPKKEDVEKSNAAEIKTESDNKPNKRKQYKNENHKTKVWSISYIFKKIKNINGKCKQLTKYQNLLLVASNNGLYEVNGEKSKIILKRNYINCVTPSKTPGIFYIGTDRGITAIKYEKNKWVEYKKIQPKGFEDPVYTIAEDENQNLWVGNNNELFYFTVGKKLVTISSEERYFEDDFPDKFSIRQINNSIYFLSSRQIYKYNPSTIGIEADNVLFENKLENLKYVATQDNINWLQNENGWVCISNKFKTGKYQLSLLNLFENIQNIYVDDNNNLWVVDGKNSLYKILAKADELKDQGNLNVFIQGISTDQDNAIPLNDINIPSEINSLSFKICAPYYLKPSAILYQYYIKGLMNDWTEWKSDPGFVFFVRPGDFRLQVRSKNVLGEISESKEYKISVKYPLWKKTWFIVSISILSILILSFFIFLIQKRRERKLQKRNKILEAKVVERTNEIVLQKEQIEYKNREITDSLNYASQIQSAILPPTEILKDSTDDYFVFNKPKDIVSGDFYWINKHNGQLVVSAADCTGHGVPGAFLSLLGVTFLNEITNKMDSLRANLILELLRKRVIESLNQGNFNKKRLDGIDLSLSIIDLSKMEMQFAGANNSIYLVRGGYLSEFKGNRMPIGLHAYKDKPFTNHDIEIKKGDLVYLFSDGYIDQFGGDYGRKFLSRNFKVLLTEIYHLPLKEQSRILAEVHDSWKGKFDQIDDILIIGLKI